MTSEKNIIQFKRAKFWTEEGILFCKMLNKNAYLSPEVDVLNNYIDAIVNLCKGKPMPFLIDLSNTEGSFLGSPAKLIASNIRLKKVRLAEAFIVNSMKMSLTANSYKRIYEPVTPFQIFDNLKDGLEYCIKIKNDYYDGER